MAHTDYNLRHFNATAIGDIEGYHLSIIQTLLALDGTALVVPGVRCEHDPAVRIGCKAIMKGWGGFN
jgi:hypothetical protein